MAFCLISGGHIIKAYLTLARPKCWLKNIFVFVPIVFSYELLDSVKLLSTIVVFVSFCLVSSAIYAFNDICDAGIDALHAIKKNRPIASGVLSKRAAGIFSIVLAAFGFVLSTTVSITSGMLILSYVILNLLYSLKVKNIPVFDCFCIAAGFVLRIYTGGLACGELVSDWLFLTVTAMSLFMAFGKRYGELSKSGNCDDTRCNQDFLRGMVFTCAGLAIVFYSLWALTRGDYLIYTVPLIAFIVAQYLMLIHRPDTYGDPTMVIFGDKVLLVTLGIYCAVAVFLLYA